MRALVQKTDSFNVKTTFWICGIDYDSLWNQLDCLQEEINGVKEWGADWCNRMKSYYLRKKIYHPIAVEILFYDFKSEWVGDCINAKRNLFEKLLKNTNE